MARYSGLDYVEADRQMLYDLTGLTESQIAELESNLEILGMEVNVSSLLTNIYHELTDTIEGKGEKDRQWNELGSDQQLDLWKSRIEENLGYYKEAYEFTDWQEEAYNNIISILSQL